MVTIITIVVVKLLNCYLFIYLFIYLFVNLLIC